MHSFPQSSHKKICVYTDLIQALVTYSKNPNPVQNYSRSHFSNNHPVAPTINYDPAYLASYKYPSPEYGYPNPNYSYSTLSHIPFASNPIRVTSNNGSLHMPPNSAVTIYVAPGGTVNIDSSGSVGNSHMEQSVPQASLENSYATGAYAYSAESDLFEGPLIHKHRQRPQEFSS